MVPLLPPAPSPPLPWGSLTDNSAVKEPGDIGAAFHLRQSREGACQEVWGSPHTPNAALTPRVCPPATLLQRTPCPDPTHEVHTVLSQPVKTLEEEKESKESNKAGAEVIPKDGEGQTSLSDSIPGTFQKVLEVEQGRTWVEQGRTWNSDILFAQLPAPHLWSYKHLTSISAALSCPKNTLPITLPKRKTRTKAWIYRT